MAPSEAPFDGRVLLDQLCRGEHLTRPAVEAWFGAVMRGALDPIALAGMLTALRTKGETVDEIAGAATAVRTAAVPVDTTGLTLADSCGTGGDGASTVNISTAAAIVAAEMGLTIAKHGNRSVSSRCGSADVLERVGVRIEAGPDVNRRCLDAHRIAFFFAPRFHAGVRHAMPARRALGVRTIFNLLGPLCNPAAPAYQLVGVYDPALCPLVAETLGRLGCRRALVVHGSGLDEIALHAPTTAAWLEDGEVRRLSLSHADVGLEPFPLEALRGGEPEEAGRWLSGLLQGDAKPAHVAAVALNAGALAWVAGAQPTLAEGYALARTTIEEGAAAERLAAWAKTSQTPDE